ncbi:GntR family transcriptional regulator [Rugosimonospora acidiphila]|uniref:GntR family transcriptional regulator n=1 Tax=Rugosimonospora acidiphila TaxID=556531 RepID=A0ABP9S9S0_9ACTN
MTDSEAPYRRIAADLRRRIADGELAPGDRVPSTRQLARDWNVALATATKVLALLHSEGLVRARPRVGTVVADRVPGREPPPAGQRPSAGRQRGGGEAELTRERIVRAGIEIADAEGLDALSMRGVAARLGVSAMSPYRYVDGREHLVLLMADAAFGEQGYPRMPPPGWRASLELTGRVLWGLHRRHPWLAGLSPLTRPLPLPNLATHADWALRALDGLGFDETEMLDLHILLYAHIQGLATHLESEARAADASGLSEQEWMDRQGPAMEAIVSSGRYPTFGSILRHFARTGYDLDLDALFELGLKFLLDGIEAEGARRLGRPPAKPTDCG